jgi:type I site-specific restriction endonuclease
MALPSETRTRQALIDRQLGRAGWPIGSRQTVEEFLMVLATGTGKPSVAPHADEIRIPSSEILNNAAKPPKSRICFNW